MKLKKIIPLIFFILLSGCGYEAIFSSNNAAFALTDIKAEGKNSINNKIKNGLRNYRSLENKSKFYELKILSNQFKKITSKDEKGNAELFQIQISFKVDVYENNEIISQKVFEESFIYSNN